MVRTTATSYNRNREAQKEQRLVASLRHVLKELEETRGQQELLQTRVSSLSGTIELLHSQLEVLSGRQDSLDDHIKGLRTEISSLRSEVRSRFSSVHDRLQSLHGNIDVVLASSDPQSYDDAMGGKAVATA